MVWAFKAFRRNKKGELCFLFKTHNGSSVVERGKWLKTKKRWVKEGSHGKHYRAGFHFFMTDEGMERFNKLTKNKYEILPVLVGDIRPKPRSQVKSWLANELYVPDEKFRYMKGRPAKIGFG